ncbi:phosphatase PAP2 family protein [Corynebacterium kroppenstedtii]|uniref:phosphatase PAP2 family protein n=1 Tax=Corynebacterium kroppenstedtii TaxID=161879 RepID=UPI00264B7CD6|nr:phosphatase PAP2 family protein [Corynebacterium kroppenstedtii]MDN8624914.1 phosphatase PAP2 family protein [Corynebacterium kroppenstedtii]
MAQAPSLPTNQADDSQAWTSSSQSDAARTTPPAGPDRGTPPHIQHDGGGVNPMAVTALLGVATVLLIIFTFTDKQVSDAVINHDSVFGTLFQSYGEFPPAVLGALAMQVLAGCLLRSSLPEIARGLGSILLTWASFLSILGWSEQAESYRRSWSANHSAGTPIGVANNDDSDTMSWSQFAPALFMAIVLLIIVSMVAWLLIRNLSDETLRLIAISAVVMLAIVWAGHGINDQMKDLWGRFRPYEVDAGKGPYQPWYHINLPNGHRSFPSGHTQEGTTLAALAIVLRPLGGKAWRIALWVGTVWGILMAASRVIIGAHWATDTVASFILTYGLILVGLWLTTWVAKRVSSTTISNDAGTPVPTS